MPNPTSPVLNFNYGTANYVYGGGVWNMGFKNDGITTQPMIEADFAQGSLVYSTVQGTHVTDMDLASANEGDTGGAGVELEKDDAGLNISHSVIANNTMCTFHGAVPTTMNGVTVGSTLTNVAITGNMFTGCSEGVTYAGTSTTVAQTGNVDP